MTKSELSPEEIDRYSRQLILKSWGTADQLHMATSVVAVSIKLPAAALYLAALGIGTLYLVSDEQSLTEELSHELLHLRPDLAIQTTATTRIDGALLLGEELPSIAETLRPACTVSICSDSGNIRIDNEKVDVSSYGAAQQSATALGILGVLLLLPKLKAMAATPA